MRKIIAFSVIVIFTMHYNLTMSQIKMDNDGKVAIGGDPASYRLKVVGSVYTTSSITSDGVYTGLIDCPSINTLDPTNKIVFGGYYGGTPHIGIGMTPSTSYALDVNGDVRGDTWTDSDIRFKKNIQPDGEYGKTHVRLH